MATAIVTMLLTLLVSGLTAPLYGLRKRMFKKEPVQTINLKTENLIAVMGNVEQLADFQALISPP